jgi:hypothetical protein
MLRVVVEGGRISGRNTLDVCSQLLDEELSGFQFSISLFFPLRPGIKSRQGKTEHGVEVEKG